MTRNEETIQIREASPQGYSGLDQIFKQAAIHASPDPNNAPRPDESFQAADCMPITDEMGRSYTAKLSTGPCRFTYLSKTTRLYKPRSSL